MKRINFYCAILMLLLTVSLNAQDQSLNRSIEKAKADLVEVLTKNESRFNFGLKIEEVIASKTAQPIPFKEMNFKALLNYNGRGIKETLSSTQKLVVPFIIESKVITTVAVNEFAPNNYKVSELINHQYHNELNYLTEEIKARQFKNITIVHIPNLKATVYMDNGKNYTLFNKRSIKEAISDSDLMKLLKGEAIKFQRKYGDQVKDGKLLN